MVLRNSSVVVAPMHWNSPLLSAGLSMFAASMVPCALPAPMMVCISSMKRITSGLSFSSFMMLRILSSNCPLYFVPATTFAMSSVTILLFQSRRLVLCRTILVASPSTIALFPTPGSPISMGLFFFLRHSICVMRSISLSLPTTGSSSPCSAAFVRSVPKPSRTGVLLFGFLPCRDVVALPASLDLEVYCTSSPSSSSSSTSSCKATSCPSSPEPNLSLETSPS